MCINFKIMTCLFEQNLWWFLENKFSWVLLKNLINHFAAKSNPNNILLVYRASGNECKLFVLIFSFYCTVISASITKKMWKKVFLKKVKNVWREFCKCNAIHGLSLIRRSKFPWILLWIIFYLGIVYITGQFCIKSLFRYLRFEVKTSMVYDTVPKIRFPAVTMCNKFSLLKSIAGTNPVILMSFVGLLIRNISQLAQVFDEVKRVSYCSF